MNRSLASERTVSRLANLGNLGLVAAAGVAALLGAACAPDKMPFPEGDTHTFASLNEDGTAKPEGVSVSGHDLNLGYQSYMRYCYACHGEKGDGHGPASYGLRPPPRNFTLGIFKFARLRSSDELPNDADLKYIVKNGLHGSAMLAWDIPDEELGRILNFIKTFAPQKWEKINKKGDHVKTLEVFQAPADPWAGKDVEAISRGQELYHLKAECLNCHPSYLGKEDLFKLSTVAAKREPDTFKAIGGFRDDPHGSVAKDSAEYSVRLLPPDFTFHQVRSIHPGSELSDLFRLISFGVYPIMPAWKGALEDKDIWAIAHYVKSLLDLRANPVAAAKLKDSFLAQTSFEIPKAPEPAAAPTDAAPADGAEKKDDKAGDVKKDDKAGDVKKDDVKKAPVKQ
jgi:mono/diheme cytochrome c family protein